MKQFTIIAVISFIIGFGLLFSAQTANAWFNPCQIIDCTPSIEVTPTPEVTPEVTGEPTTAPTEAVVPTTPPAPGGDGLHTGGDGLHTAPDGLGCAVHECRAIPLGPPNTGKGR